MASSRGNRKTVRLDFGGLCEPINVQLSAQGLKCTESDIEKFQALADAITILSVHAIIPQATVRDARQKLTQQIADNLAEQ